MNLKYLLTTKSLTGRQISWAEFISRLRYVFYYRKETEKERPEALSRRDQDRPKKGGPRLPSQQRKPMSPVELKKIMINKIRQAEEFEKFTDSDLEIL